MRPRLDGSLRRVALDPPRLDWVRNLRRESVAIAGPDPAEAHIRRCRDKSACQSLAGLPFVVSEAPREPARGVKGHEGRTIGRGRRTRPGPQILLPSKELLKGA